MIKKAKNYSFILQYFNLRGYGIVITKEREKEKFMQKTLSACASSLKVLFLVTFQELAFIFFNRNDRHKKELSYIIKGEKRGFFYVQINCFGRKAFRSA